MTISKMVWSYQCTIAVTDDVFLLHLLPNIWFFSKSSTNYNQLKPQKRVPSEWACNSFDGLHLPWLPIPSYVDFCPWTKVTPAWSKQIHGSSFLHNIFFLCFSSFTLKVMIKIMLGIRHLTSNEVISFWCPFLRIVTVKNIHHYREKFSQFKNQKIELNNYCTQIPGNK